MESVCSKCILSTWVLVTKEETNTKKKEVKTENDNEITKKGLMS